MFNKLHPVRSKWFDIGVQLGVEAEKLVEIRKCYPDHQDGLREMLIHRLKHQDLTYESLHDALKAPAVGERRLSLSEEYN